MGFELDAFSDARIDADFLEWLVDVHSASIHRHFSRLWDYYANPTVEVTGATAAERKVGQTGRSYVQAQEAGLPFRITGVARQAQFGAFDARAIKDIQRKEVVIENDIAWRVNAAADFLFGKPISIASKAPDGRRRSEIEAILRAVFAANGGLGFFQDMAVLGSVYGFVDCFVRPPSTLLDQHFTSHSNRTCPLATVLQLAQAIGLELIEAPRALPVLDEDDYRVITHYVQHFCQKKNTVNRKNSFLSRLLATSGQRSDTRQVVTVTEITSAQYWQRYEDKELVAEGSMPWGFLPVVHIQNIAQPYYYEGVSDVEPLIPLQDELNTRLSDRANRITFQSFKMYLGKGIEGFEDKPIAPGRMWCTDNPEASIQEFGGDAAAPSESSHIAEIREALDKASGVTPVVAGVLKDKLGNLTSAVALRLTFMGMLSKNERKRHTYSEGVRQICRMVLSMLDTAGIYASSEDERDVEVVFASPLPENVVEKLQEAQIKRDLGVPTEQVLRELGYETTAEQNT
ncbi:MAG: phage portal protein [Sedimentisphaerales bacterium]|nr:phage portal protein [Sedimentisphaerales bacterium]